MLLKIYFGCVVSLFQHENEGAFRGSERHRNYLRQPIIFTLQFSNYTKVLIGFRLDECGL